MKRLSPVEVLGQAIAGLGLDPSKFGGSSVEFLAAALRRAAGFLCPCPSRTLADAVLEAAEGIVPTGGAYQDTIVAVLEDLIAIGDLSEHRDVSPEASPGGSLVYMSPPTFVRRASGDVVILGVLPDSVCALPLDMERSIVHDRHLRIIRATADYDVSSRLHEFGFIELSHDAWVKAPGDESASSHLARFARSLDAAPKVLAISSLSIIDPDREVKYYRGRWTEPRGHSGRFVGRRSQAYGADLWCYVEIEGGNPRRFIDLPSTGSRLRGCDEAWRLQMAIDSTNGRPQEFEVVDGRPGTKVIKLFSPIPGWAERRWTSIGHRVDSQHCLLSYSFRTSEVKEEVSFAQQKLWLRGSEPTE